MEDAKYRSENVPFLASYGDDCREVKSILADLLLDGPPLGPEDKKFTAAQTDAWLRKQRTENKQLADAIQKQLTVTFVTENNRIAIDMCKKKLESLSKLMALRTAQIEFLVGS